MVVIAYRLLLLMLLVVSGVGCSSTQPFSPGPAAEPDNARVYVYWPGQRWREKAGSSFELQVNGVPVGLLRYKRYLEVELPPGNHEFRLTGNAQSADWQADWDGHDQVFVKPVESGEVLYARLLIKYDQQNMNWKGLGMDHVVQFLPRSAGSARMEMAALQPSRH